MNGEEMAGLAGGQGWEMTARIRRAHLALALAATMVAAPAWPQSRGEWVADRRSGCKVWSPNPLPGESIAWSGDCRDELATGRGVLQWFQADKPLSRCDCELAGGKIGERAVVAYTDGSRYDGQFRDNRFHGHGIVQYANGMRYDGEFRDGLPNGYGTFTGNGQTFAGNWTRGCFSQGDMHISVVKTPEECGFR